MTETVLETDGLTKRFGKLTAVDDVSLSVADGEFRSVIGPNGAGKTTTFNLITGALSPSEGAVRFKGEDITNVAPHERVGRGLGRSFQITNVFGGLTVRENVRLAAQSVYSDEINPGEALFRDKNGFDEIAEQTRTVLEQIGLRDRADEHAEALAYGDQRRLELGLVLATDPALVMLDEPTAGMSSEETQATMNLIDEVLSDRSLMLIEHDIDLVMRVSDRITVLTRGEELASGTPEEIANNEDVRDAYLGGVRE
ncbi:ABC transporter ATP-binding protein [Haloarcula argentinensis]|uniref:Probable branched-chain amino acid transport ATP-binding protein LivG n=1 Tax=Haloarcula argentinensis TaxID=43776 RepID=A0A830FR00_HALAR|nr:ABC transporter ATP-binding protein [Haloarcula argentinensis]EMA17872.1 branched-chain amino acid ABC transporter ATP-binding protein [Haloarcula argentinensis DSM 12282]MDS0255673.1 ABC transporter ATP-binding protein [Haloarcula argentinensis]GGM48480.1 ABC transporter ATP-binding protein [Haloarcula argentinensis]